MRSSEIITLFWRQRREMTISIEHSIKIEKWHNINGWREETALRLASRESKRRHQQQRARSRFIAWHRRRGRRDENIICIRQPANKAICPCLRHRFSRHSSWRQRVVKLVARVAEDETGAARCIRQRGMAARTVASGDIDLVANGARAASSAPAPRLL